MRWLINYLRSCFCKHDWEKIFDNPITNNKGEQINWVKVYRCKKCGMEMKYKVL